MKAKYSFRSFAKLEKEMLSIASLYFDALNLIQVKNINNEKHQRFIDQVQGAYSLLNENERNLINNDFFFQKYPFWWKDKYTRFSYLKLKNKSMIHFLEKFYYEKF